MAQTPLSAADPYLTAARTWLYRDERTVLELLADDDTAPTAANAEDATHAAGKRLLAALRDASGTVDAKVLAGRRYTPADLAALTGNGLALLEGLVADLAFWRLAKRRWPQVKPDQVSGAADALDRLKELATGEAIFGLTETAAVGEGLPEVQLPDLRLVEGPVAAVGRATRLYGSAANTNYYGSGS